MRSRRIGAVVLVLVCAAAVAAVLGGSSRHAPAVALGPVMLLQLERAAVAVAVVAFVATLILRGLAGQLPTKFGSSGVEYASDKVAADLERRITMLERRLQSNDADSTR